MSDPIAARKAALAALREANALYRQASAHRDEIVGLCLALDIAPSEVRSVLGIERDRDPAEPK